MARRHGDYRGLLFGVDLGGSRLDKLGRVSVVAGFLVAPYRVTFLFGPSLQRTTNLELERTRGIRLFN